MDAFDVGEPGMIELVCVQCQQRFLRSKLATFHAAAQHESVCFECYVRFMFGVPCDYVIVRDPERHRAPLLVQTGETFQMVGRSSASRKWFCMTQSGEIVEKPCDSEWEYA